MLWHGTYLPRPVSAISAVIAPAMVGDRKRARSRFYWVSGLTDHAGNVPAANRTILAPVLSLLPAPTESARQSRRDVSGLAVENLRSNLGRKALKLVNQRGPNLILLEVFMSGMSGHKFIRVASHIPESGGLPFRISYFDDALRSRPGEGVGAGLPRFSDQANRRGQIASAGRLMPGGGR
jgi:CheY-like chemotaxis protein